MERLLWLNKIFLLLSLVAGIYLLVSASLLFIPIQEPKIDASEIASLFPGTLEEISYQKSEVEPFSDYLLVKSGTLFLPFTKKEVTTAPEEAPLGKSSFNLQGIIWSSQGGVALIKTGEGKRLLSLKKGDAIEGYTVTEVTKQKVILEKEKEKIVLTLEYPQIK